MGRERGSTYMFEINNQFITTRVNHILQVTKQNTKQATNICPNSLSQFVRAYSLCFNFRNNSSCPNYELHCNTISHLHLCLWNPPKERHQKRNPLLNLVMVTQQYSCKSQTRSPEDTLHTTLNVPYYDPTYVDT